MRKKLLALLLTAAMAVLTFSGCGKKAEPLPDTLRFINAAYSVLTVRNGGDYKYVGGYHEKDSVGVVKVKEGLKSAWDVTDTESAISTMDWLVQGGHNADMLQAYKDNTLDTFTRSELEEALAEPDFTPADQLSYLCVYDAVEKFGDNAILAWDLSRAEQLLGWYYLAGYYTYEEAMDQSLEIAKTLQESYSSWDEMMESYFLGYQYWSEESIDDSEAEAYSRYQLYEELKAEENGPFTVDWNTKLQKEW